MSTLLRHNRLEDLVLGLRSKLETMARATEVESSGNAFGDAEHDTTIRADRVLGNFLRDRLNHLIGGELAAVTVEGDPQIHDRIDPSEIPGYLAFVDPLDGSLNFRTRGKVMGLPYTTCVTLVEARPKHPSCFSDICASFIIDLRTGDYWMGDRTDDCYEGSSIELEDTYELRTATDTKLDLGSQIVIGEMYYPSNRERLVRAFAGEKGWLRNPGSAAYEMALVASGTAVAFISDQQKQHELGAGYFLVKGAGGVCVDFDGKDLGDRIFDFRTQTPCILAANQAIADQILERLHR